MSIVVPLHTKNNWYLDAMERLVTVVGDLSRARTLDEVAAVVRVAARELTGADGATFVLRDGEQCFYADENAISPLWKGQRFPLDRCISGWVIQNGESVMIDDIYADPRIPAEAYRPTFVKSMAMVPIRSKDPMGAIGNYWARSRRLNDQEMHILQALADVTAVAVENARLNADLEKKIKAVENANAALSRFAWISSHDLKAPLRAIDNITQWVIESIDRKQPAEAKEHVKVLQGRVHRMERLLDDILEYAQLEHILDPNSVAERVNGAELLTDVIDLAHVPEGFEIQINDGFRSVMLPRMPLQQVFSTLINNAIAHNTRKKGALVSIDCEETGTQYLFTVSDNGPGIGPDAHERMFDMFQVVKSREAKEQGGMGLALVKKILDVYGSSIRVDSIIGRGSIFRFTWNKPLESSQPAGTIASL